MPRRPRPVLRPAPVTRLSHPAAPDGLLPRTRAAWTAFWLSPMSTLVSEDTDVVSLRHLFELYDERDRMMTTIRASDGDDDAVAARVVTGSRGQPRPNPLYGVMAEMETPIRQLEDRFGLSPRARAVLRLDLSGDGSPDVDRLNDALSGAADDDDLDADPDFRLSVVDGRAG